MIIPKLSLERKVLYVCKAILNFMDILSFPFVLLVNYFEFNIYTVCQWILIYDEWPNKRHKNSLFIVINRNWNYAHQMYVRH